MKWWKKLKRWWQRITDTKPTPKVGDKRIHKGRAQMLMKWEFDGATATIKEQWEDILAIGTLNDNT